MKAKSSGSNLNSKWLEARDSSAGLEAWEVILGPAHPGDARLDSPFKVVAELSVLRRVGEEAVLLAVDPEGRTFTEGATLGRISRHVAHPSVLVRRGSETS